MHANPGLMCLSGVCADKNTYPSAAALRLHSSHGTSAPASCALMMLRLSSCAFLRRTSPSPSQRQTTHKPACPSAVFIYRGLDPTGPVPERTHIYRREPPAYPATTPTPGLNAGPPTNPLVHSLYSYIGDWTQRGLYPSARTYTAVSHPLIRQQHPPRAQRRTTHSPACPSAVDTQRVQARKRSSPRECEVSHPVP